MKKIFYALTVALLVLVSVSCQEDDITSVEPPVVEPINFNGTYVAEKVHMKVSGHHFDLSFDQTVVISGEEQGPKTIVIPAGMVPGEGVLTFAGVVETQENHGIAKFSGSLSNADRDLALTGSAADGELNISIVPNYKNDMVGVWNMPTPEYVDGEDATMYSVMPFEVKNTDGNSQLFGMPYPDKDFSEFLSGIAGLFVRAYVPLDPAKPKELTGVGALQKITFHADGNLTAQYNLNFDPTIIMAAMGMPGAAPVAPKWADSPMGAMRWYVKGDKLFLVPNLNLMTKAGISSDGLPLSLRKDAKYSYVYVTKELVAPLLNLVNMIVAGLPNDVIGEDLAPLAKMLVNDIAFTANKAETFNIGINLKKEAK